MKIIEELKLKDTISYISRFEAKHQTLDKIYQNIGDLNLFSIQNNNYQFDKEFFDEVSFVLSVIITIINHPHISSFDIDEIIRADLAGHIENDSFQMVFKDASLWKDKDGEMIPENVYYHEHIDEIKIYENIFIGMLINLIEQDLKKSLEFYISLLPIIEYKKTLFTTEEVKYAIKKIELQLKKIRYIKETYFYKQIKKCDLSNRKIIPTNILVKDRLYNYCFKFYKKFVSYVDLNSLNNDFSKYYFYLILQQLKKRKAHLEKANKDFISFSLNDTLIDITRADKKPILKVSIKNHVNNDLQLICITDINQIDLMDILVKEGHIVTMWNLYDSDYHLINHVALSEAELIKEWLEQVLFSVSADVDIYSKYCPVCKAKSISLENDIYECDNCHSRYSFVNDSRIWFLRVRGK